MKDVVGELPSLSWEDARKKVVAAVELLLNDADRGTVIGDCSRKGLVLLGLNSSKRLRFCALAQGIALGSFQPESKWYHRGMRAAPPSALTVIFF